MQISTTLQFTKTNKFEIDSNESICTGKTITCRARKGQLSDPQNKLEIFTFVEGVGEAETRDKGKS